MQNNLRLYNTVLKQINQWLPNKRVTRRRNLALLVTGIYLSASVHLSLVVRTWPLMSKAPSLVNRLRRFLDNKHVSPQAFYEPLVQQLLMSLAGHRLQLVIDTTQVGFHYRALVVGLCYRKRTLPLAWSLHQGRIGNTPVTAQIALLNYLHPLIPVGTKVCLIGDAAFRTGDLFLWLHEHGWHYVIRQQKEVTIRTAYTSWQPIATIPLSPGETKLLGPLWMARTNPFGPTWLVLHWEKGEDKPWLLVTDIPCSAIALRLYRRRMWVEEMIGDMKKHGFNLESTHLRHLDRIERLMLGVCIAYVWLVALGSWVVKNGYRHLVDRKDRRDKSYFRIGWDWVERCLRLGQPVRLRFIPYFSK